MQSILESAIDAAIDAEPDVAPLILLGVPGGLSAAVESSRWDSSGLNRSVRAMVHMDASDCSSLVLHRIVGAESWRHAAANTMTRLHECRSDRYEAQLHKASGWLALALKVLAAPTYVASDRYVSLLRGMQHALTELQGQAPAAALSPALTRELQHGQVAMALAIEKRSKPSRQGPPRWTEQQLLPDRHELDSTPELQPNQVEAGYSDVDSYVKTHFDLLREDFMRPLREMVEKARQGLELPQSASMWRGVTLGAAAVGEPGGMLHSLHLDEEQANGLATSQGNGLINGALLVLSSDNFATVLLRPTSLQPNPNPNPATLTLAPAPAPAPALTLTLTLTLTAQPYPQPGALRRAGQARSLAADGGEPALYLPRPRRH